MDSAIHMMSKCQHNMIRIKISERHNTASRHIVKARTNSIHGANIACTDIGSAAKLADEGVHTSDIAHQTLPAWLMPGLSNQGRSAHDRMPSFYYAGKYHAPSGYTPLTPLSEQLKKVRLIPRRCYVHLIEFKYCEDTRPKSQFRKAQEQYSACEQVS